MGDGWSTPRPGCFIPWKDSLCRRLGGPQGRSGRVREISPPNVILSLDRPARTESLYGSSKSTVNWLSQFEPTNARNFIKITIILQHTRCYMFRPSSAHHQETQNCTKQLVKNFCMQQSWRKLFNVWYTVRSRSNWSLKTIKFKTRYYETKFMF